MASFIPLIRTAVIVPWLRWLKENGRPVDERLREAGLTYLAVDDPNRPVPLLPLVEFVRTQSRIEGPDLAARVVTATSIAELANLGLVMLYGPTLRDSLIRIERAMPRHSTHELFQVEETGSSMLVRECWQVAFDPESLHVVHQFVAAVTASLVRSTGWQGPEFEHLSLASHPELGLAHLATRFGGVATAATEPVIRMEIAQDVVERPMDPNEVGCERDPLPSTDTWRRLRGDSTLRASVVLVIEAMLGHGPASIERVAASAGMTTRTLQRDLAREGAEFSDLVDQVRRSRAMEVLCADTCPELGKLATSLGYTNSSAFTRAFRRWTGMPPRAFLRAGRQER
jgi:AraC-like DNA-binding protein